jgi:hypothetical protein
MSSNRHHRCPRSHGGTKNKPVRGNCVKVDKDKHHFWHCLFDNLPGEQVMNELNTKWLDPRFKVVRVG